MNNSLILYLTLTLLAALIVVAMTCSYQDELNEQSAYTKMVCEGIYPDYKHLEPDCSNTPTTKEKHQ